MPEALGEPTTAVRVPLPPGAMPAGYGVVLDPMRPHEVTEPPGGALRPPSCPECEAALYFVRVNEGGDSALFECLNDGYEAIWRGPLHERPSLWEPFPRPNLVSSEWKAPLGGEVAAPAAQALPPGATTAPRGRGRGKAGKVAKAKADATATTPAAPPAAVKPPASAAEIDWVTLADGAAIAGTTPNALYLRVKRGTLASKHGEDGRILVRGDQLGTPE